MEYDFELEVRIPSSEWWLLKVSVRKYNLSGVSSEIGGF